MKKTIFCLFTLVLATNVVMVLASDGHGAHWAYEGHAGPDHWANLDHDFMQCQSGREQSPIDISTSAVERANLAPIKLTYNPAPAELVNNGHTIQVNLTEGGSMKVPSGEYKILQFHFHTPSEEKIDGRSFPLVIHLVHKNAAGQLAVIAVLVNAGEENPVLKDIFADLPAKHGKALLQTHVDLSGLVPVTLGYYIFKGSLTTPPCSEGVTWHVLKTPIEMSLNQINAFKQVVKMNARPVQPLNGRKISEVN
jgi:carbonic anhydrase